MATFSDDVVWRVGGHNALSGVHRGREELGRWFQKVFELGGGEDFRAQPEDILGDDHFVMVFLRIRARRADETYEGMIPNAFRIVEGKIVESWFIPDDQARFDAFWS